jgi:hypothetical protein
MRLGRGDAESQGDGDPYDEGSEGRGYSGGSGEYRERRIYGANREEQGGRRGEYPRQSYGSQGQYGRQGGYGQEYGGGPESWRGSEGSERRGQGSPRYVGPESGGYRSRVGEREEGRYGSNPRLSEGFEREGQGGSRGSGSYGSRGMGSGQGSYGSTYGTSASSWESQGSFGSTRGRFTGKGPKGYQRSDERIREDASDALERNGDVDASDIEVKVHAGEITLEGTVSDRRSKRMAEDLIEDLPGVKQVHNRLRVEQGGDGSGSKESSGSASMKSGKSSYSSPSTSSSGSSS